MNDNLKTWPEKIYLQTDGEIFDIMNLEGVTWCDDRTDQHDVEYIRADITEAQAVIAEYQRRNPSLADDPQSDATDFAHPAWWRGHEYTTKMFCQLVEKILDSKDDGRGIASDPWESVRRRLLELVKQHNESVELVEE